MICCLGCWFLSAIDTKAKESEDPLQLTAPSAVLIESHTGQILYEKNKDQVLPPASVTKIMTLLLIMEAIDQNKLSYEDQISVSEHAASMGGSQVFLEPGEIQTVQDMLKCITIASANDACVAMAEAISGSEEAFVDAMNAKAEQLHMQNTHFVNCCGLDVAGHVTTAYDIALMSRELTVKYPDIFQFTTIWMDTITHTTSKGSKEFGLSNTNKLIKHYAGATGLKTGSTSKAKFCLSATASKNNMDLIAVVMASNSSKDRVKDATKLLDYGFNNYQCYQDVHPLEQPVVIPLSQGRKAYVEGIVNNQLSVVLEQSVSKSEMKKKIKLKDHLDCPVNKGDRVGSITYYMGSKKLEKIPIVAKESVEKWRYRDCIWCLLHRYIGCCV